MLADVKVAADLGEYVITVAKQKIRMFRFDYIPLPIEVEDKFLE
jgi:hypothetical protein